MGALRLCFPWAGVDCYIRSPYCLLQQITDCTNFQFKKISRMNKASVSPHLQDQRLAPDIALANDLDRASQLVVEIKRKALDVEHLLQEDIRASHSSSYGASTHSAELTSPRSPQRNFDLSLSSSRPPLSVEERQILSDKICQLEDDLRIEKLKNKSLCSTYTTDVAELMAQVSDLKMSSAVNNTQTFLHQKPPGLSSSMMNASMPGLQELGKSVGDRLLLSGYFRDDPQNMALSVDSSATGSSLAASTTIPHLGTTLTASRVNPGFMGRLGPEYPDIYDHRYATISAPDLDKHVDKAGASIVESTGPSLTTVHYDSNKSVPDPADGPTSLSIPATPGPKSFLSVLTFNPAVISNHQRILTMMARSKLGAMAQLNTVAASMTEAATLASTYIGMDTGHAMETPTGHTEGHNYALTPLTDFLNRQQSPTTLANLTARSNNTRNEHHHERQLQTPGPRRPNYQVRMDAMGNSLKTPVLGQDLVNPALIQNLEFVRLYLSNHFEKNESVRSLYNSIVSMPEFQSALQIMTESCVEEALTVTSLLEAKSVEAEVLKSRVLELETTLAQTLKDQLVGTKEATYLKSSHWEHEDTEHNPYPVGSSVTTISQLGHEVPLGNADKVIAGYESTIDSLTQMVNHSAAEALRISVDETEQRREKEAYKAKLEALTSSFEKITQSNYELQQQLDALTARSKAVEDDQKRVRISQLHDEIQAYREENRGLKAQLNRIREAAKAYQSEVADDIPIDMMIQTLVDYIATKSTDLRQLEHDNRKLTEENTKLVAEISSLRTQIQELRSQQDGAVKSFNDMRLLYIEENKILKEENTLLEEEKRLSEYKNGLLQKKLKTLSDLSECEYTHGNMVDSSPLQNSPQ